MKPKAPDEYLFEGDTDLGGEKQTYRISEDGMKWILHQVINQYSDRMLAVIREISTNAEDSRKEAGSNKPIQVTLPTMLDQEFVVEDWGTGLTPENVMRAFARPGYSTKRQSDEYTGMLGIGTKSPLSYAPSFTVTAVKDGVVSELVIGKNKEGLGEVEKFVYEDEGRPDGVRVSVPVPHEDIQDFRAKALWFFKFWRDPLEITNDEHKLFYEHSNWTQVDPDVYVNENRNTRHTSNSYVVMGNVPYKVDHMQTLGFDQNFIVFVEIGTVQFSPPREELVYDDDSNYLFLQLKKFIKERRLEALQEGLDQLPYEHAFRKWLEIHYDDRNELKWQGRVIRTAKTLRGSTRTVKDDSHEKAIEAGGLHRADEKDDLGRMDADRLFYTGSAVHYPKNLEIFVVNFTKINVAGYDIARCWQYVYENCRHYFPEVFGPRFVFRNRTSGDEVRVIDWEDVKDKVGPMQPYSYVPVTETEKITVFDNNSRKRDMDDIDPTDTFVLLNRTSGNDSIARKGTKVTGVPWVMVSANSHNRIQREYPNVLDWEDEKDKKQIAYLAFDHRKINTKHFLVHGFLLSYSGFRQLQRIPISRIEDPDLRSFRKQIQGDNPNSLYADSATIWSLELHRYMKSRIKKKLERHVAALSRYPFLVEETASTDQWLTYLNNAYKETQ